MRRKFAAVQTDAIPTADSADAILSLLGEKCINCANTKIPNQELGILPSSKYFLFLSKLKTNVNFFPTMAMMMQNF